MITTQNLESFIIQIKQKLYVGYVIKGSMFILKYKSMFSNENIDHSKINDYIMFIFESSHWWYNTTNIIKHLKENTLKAISF